MSITRTMCAVGVLWAVSTPTYSRGEGHWVPDSKTVGRIEQVIRQMPLPKTGNWIAAWIVGLVVPAVLYVAGSVSERGTRPALT